MDKDKPGILTIRQEPIRDHPDAILVVLEGSIDPKTNVQFRDALAALVTAGKKKFYLECTDLTYVNSSGLAYMLNVVGTVKPKGGTVVLAGMDAKIQVIFKMMGITELFQFFPTFKEALRDLDAKLAQELSDVGPALKLVEDAPKPVVAPTPRPAPMPVRKSSPQTDRMTRKIRPATPPPSGNPFVQFFRWLFGGGESSGRRFSPMKKFRR
jgi:anti-anti-sigma factor